MKSRWYDYGYLEKKPIQNRFRKVINDAYIAQNLLLWGSFRIIPHFALHGTVLKQSVILYSRLPLIWNSQTHEKKRRIKLKAWRLHIYWLWNEADTIGVYIRKYVIWMWIFLRIVALETSSLNSHRCFALVFFTGKRTLRGKEKLLHRKQTVAIRS